LSERALKDLILIVREARLRLKAMLAEAERRA